MHILEEKSLLEETESKNNIAVLLLNTAVPRSFSLTNGSFWEEKNGWQLYFTSLRHKEGDQSCLVLLLLLLLQQQ